MGAHLAKLGRGLSHGPWLWVLSGGKSRRSLPTSHLQAARACQCRASANATALWPTAAPADTGQGKPGIHGSNQAQGSARMSAPGWAMARRTKRPQPARPPERLEHLFRAAVYLTQVQSVNLQGCLRNRSEKSIRPNLRITFRFDYHQTRLVERFTNLQ